MSRETVGRTEERRVFVAGRPSPFETMRKIISTLREDDFLTSADVAKMVGVSRLTAKHYLEELVTLAELIQSRGVPAKLRVAGREVYFLVRRRGMRRRRRR